MADSIPLIQEGIHHTEDTTLGADKSLDSIQEMIQQLAKAGIDKTVVEKLIQTNQKWFMTLHDYNTNEFNKQIRLLERLAKYPKLNPIILNHPESAGLLAASANPERTAKVIDVRDDTYSVLERLYAQYTVPTDWDDLTEILSRRGDIICRVSQYADSVEKLFWFPLDGAGAQAYETWLARELKTYLNQPETALYPFCLFVSREGPSIRRRMMEDLEFRLAFPDVIWPRFIRILEVKNEPFIIYLTENVSTLDEAHFWDLLALPDGEALVRRWGLFPCHLLYGREAFPETFHRPLIQALLCGNELTLEAILSYGHEPLFRELFTRELSDTTMAAALNQVSQAGHDYLEKLRYFSTLSNSVLTAEVGPPPEGPKTWIPLYYTVYEVPKKIIQGREVPFWDLLNAGLDLVTVVLPGAKGGKVLITSLKEVGKKSAVEGGKKVVQENAKKIFVSQMYTQMQKLIKNKSAEWLAMDITPLCQKMFELTGVGRESFRRWTTLEARLFMRKDAKVVIQVNNAPPRIKRFFSETVTNAGIDTAAGTSTGQETIRTIVRAARTLDDELIACKENISAWWLMNAAEIPAGN